MPETPATLDLSAEGWRRGGIPWVPVQPFYAVLGDPIGHSRSPILQAAALCARGIDRAYLAARVCRGALVRLRADDWDPGLAGFNVTAPLKEEAYDLCDQLTGEARQVGAVNTVRVEGRRWTGHNTDVAGIETVLREHWARPRRAAPATVVGTGGSARAAVLALARLGVTRISVLGHSAAGKRRFRQWLDRTGAVAGRVSLADAGSRAGEDGSSLPGTAARLWIVCLPPGVAYPPCLDVSAEVACGLLVDLRYGSALPAAPLLGPGVSVVDGLPVLLVQGGHSFSWWFGPPVPWTAMRSALFAAG